MKIQKHQEPRRLLVLGMSTNVGGVENYIMNLYRHLDKSRYQFFFVTRDGKIAFKEEIEQTGGIVKRLPSSRRNYIRYLFMWYWLFRKNTFDAILYNTCDIVSIDVLKFAKMAKVPIRIIHSHTSRHMRQWNFFHRWQEAKNRKTIDKYATHCWACSKAAGDWMYGGKDFTIINNGIETGRFRYQKAERDRLREQLGIHSDVFVLGTVGRMSREKNHLFTLDVLAELCRQILTAKLIIVGDGEMRVAIEQKVDELGLREKVVLIGIRNDVPALMSAMDCFILPSEFEGFPFVMVEAQTNGLPCVVSSNISRDTDITGAVTYVDLADSPCRWADVISKFPVSADRESAHRIVREKGFDINDVVGKIEALVGSGFN